MIDGIHADLLTVVDAVTIESPFRYSLLGMVRELDQPTANIENSERAALSRLVDVLSIDLYEHLYIRPIERPDPGRVDMGAMRDHIAALSSANSGSGTWEPGWTIREVDAGGRVVVVRNKIRFWCSPSEVRVQGGAVEPGARCRLRVPKEQRSRLPGFYLAIGDADAEDEVDTSGVAPLFRVYWHLTVGVAAPFVASATSLLNAARIPFRLKVLSDPANYYRADAGVIFIPGNHDQRIGTQIAEIHANVASGMRREVPLFTRPIVDGVGVSESPSGPLSFGQSRCQLVAQALCDSFATGDVERAARAAALSRAFVEKRLDPLHPYLESSSREPMRFLPYLKTIIATRIPSSIGIALASRPVITPLDAANRIGSMICRTAHWDRRAGLCNWMGRSDADLSSSGTAISTTSSALNGDLYQGTAGVALFLAQLFHLTGDREYQEVSRAAIARSIRQLDRSTGKGRISPLSLFSGSLGVVFAAERIRELTGMADLGSRLESILDRVFDAVSEPHELDLIGGNAGAIPALLSLAAIPGRERCRALASALGEELLAVCEPRTDPEPGTRPPPPTGLAHGAAGIGLALMELYRATGRVDFLEAGRSAFELEDRAFDPEPGNWADRRIASGGLIYERTWCHGAPGIALSRIRAAALDPENAERYRTMGRIAIGTTLSAIDQNRCHPRYDASLCHGLAGLGEVVLIAGQSLGDRDYVERAQELGRTMIERHAHLDDWPSGVRSGGPHPSLMLGLAGIGHWFLRLHDTADVPSILLLIPRESHTIAAELEGLALG